MELFLKELQSILYRKNFFYRKDDSRKLQKIVTDGFSDIKTGIGENGAQPDYAGGGFPRKIHEFHRYLL